MNTINNITNNNTTTHMTNPMMQECGGGSTLEHTPCSTTLPSLPSSLLSSLTAQPRISRHHAMAEAKVSYRH